MLYRMGFVCLLLGPTAAASRLWQGCLLRPVSERERVRRLVLHDLNVMETQSTCTLSERQSRDIHAGLPLAFLQALRAQNLQ